MTDQVPRPYPEIMSDAPDSHELARRLAVLEERMETTQERLNATLEGFRKDMAQRETRLIVTIAGLIIGGGGLAVAFLAFLIGLPGPG